MNSEIYVTHAMRTDNPLTMELQSRLTDPDFIRLLHAGMGLCTESGEFMDMLKRHLFYGKPLDLVNAKEELGDSMWYIALAVDVISTTLNEVMTVNINKLKLRYPEKFSEIHAIDRDVVAERELLEITDQYPAIRGESVVASAMQSLVSHTDAIPQVSQRGADWLDFAHDVFAHIENYTVKQYGDAPEDQVENWTIEHCLEEAKKYINRYGKVTQERQLRDFLKMAHYVQLAHLKHNNLLAEQQHS